MYCIEVSLYFGAKEMVALFDKLPCLAAALVVVVAVEDKLLAQWAAVADFHLNLFGYFPSSVDLDFV